MKNTPLDLLLDKIMDIFLDKNNKLIGQIFYTKLGRLQIFLILTMIFGVLTNIPYSNVSDSMIICMLIMLIYPIQLGLIMIVYAWIINPINNFKLSMKVKNTYKNLLNKIKKGDKKIIIDYPKDNHDTYLIYNLIYENAFRYGKDGVSLTTEPIKEWMEIPYIRGYEFKNLVITANVPREKKFDEINTKIVYNFDDVRKV